MEGTISLIKRAQDGDELACTKLFSLIRDHHMMRYARRYMNRNVLISDAEVESEFMIGCWRALSKAKLDVGNPLNFMCWKGQKAVLDLFKGRIRKEVHAQCLNCGWTGPVGWQNHSTACRDCDSGDLYTWMVEHSDQLPDPESESATSLAVGMDAETAWQTAVYGIQIEELRGRLQGRARDLFDKIIFEGVSRGSTPNYLEKIAEEWGVSTPAVAAALRRLRRDVLNYLET